MPKVKLTPKFVSIVECPATMRKVDYFDTGLPGFLVEVRQSGGKTYYQRYRTAHGAERQYKIGPASVLTLREARRKARAIAASALLGEDPQRLRHVARQTPRYADFLMNVYLPFAKANKRSWRTDLAVLRTHIIPHLGRYYLDEVTAHSVAELLQTMRANGYASGTTNRVLILLRHTFNLANRWGLSGATANPTTGIKTAPDVQRERFLSDEELVRLRASLSTDQNRGAANAIRLLLLTGGRRNEITHAKWEYVDWAASRLLVPVSKPGKPRWIKLNPQAVSLLRSIQSSADGPFIFPSPMTGRPCPSLHFPWKRIKKRAGLEGLRLHDLRHSYASLLVNGNISIYTGSQVVGHTHARATQRYAHLTEETLREAVDFLGRRSGPYRSVKISFIDRTYRSVPFGRVRLPEFIQQALTRYPCVFGRPPSSKNRWS